MLISVLSVVFSVTAQGADAQQASQAELEPVERWFEIEIILYKPNNTNLQEGESWDTDTKLELPDNLVDFLQPYGFPEVEPTESVPNNLENSESNNLESAIEQIEPEQSEINQVVDSQNDILEITQETTDKQNLINSGTEVGSELVENSLDESLNIEPAFEPEKPFLSLDASLLRLVKEAKSIDSNSKYQLLGHFAWRQPVADKSSAHPIRIAGGADFKETFEYSGAKIIQLPPTEEFSDEEILFNELAEDATLTSEKLVDDTDIQQELLNEESTKEDNEDLESKVAEQNENIDVSVIQNPEELINTLSEADVETAIEEPQPIALPWVPEVDGSLIVFIHRNYLHINTNIFYRLPGKEEIDLYSLGNSFTSLGNALDNKSLNFDRPIINSLTENPLADNPLADTSLTDSRTFEDSSSYGDNQLVWHYQDDFLLEEPEKKYTERLFNYPLKQNRRLRSTELHYLDHPLIGMLVMITPYEINVEEPSSELETLQP